MGLPRWISGKESACQCKRPNRCSFNPWVGKIPWRRKWQPTPVLLSRNFHGQRSLAGYSPRCHKELDTAMHAHMPLISHCFLWRSVWVLLLLTLLFLLLFLLFEKLFIRDQELRLHTVETIRSPIFITQEEGTRLVRWNSAWTVLLISC